jgi:hypothetical protein
MILLKALTMSLFCFGAYAGMDDVLSYFGMTREELYGRLTDPLRFFATPIIGCVVCACTFWGLIAYWLMPFPSIGEALICWFICCFINKITAEFVSL